MAADNNSSLKGSIEDALELNPDIIILTGGVSAGDYDLVPDMLQELGVEILFHKVKQKPGKPILFGKTDEQLVFGLPGNPVAAFLGFELYVGPVIRRMMGQTEFETRIHEAKLLEDLKVKSNRSYFPQGNAKNIEGGWNIEPLKSKGSADIFTVTKANSFMMLDEGKYVLSSGENVKFFFIRGESNGS